MADDITRRDFVKTTAAGTVALTAASASLDAMQAATKTSGTPNINIQIISALGSVFIPSKPGDPGYKDLEQYKISEHVLEHVPGSALEDFNNTAKTILGKTFVELDEKGREEYLRIVAKGSGVTDQADGRNLVDGNTQADDRIKDEALRKKLQAFYRAARRQIFEIYYGNFPEDEIKRGADGYPILKAGDTHQDLNPNTSKIFTGWDLAGYKGVLNFADEEKIRERAKKTLPYWDDADLAKLSPTRPPASTPTKMPDGKDYYDVIVLGGGTAGCIIAGRIAERGLNPKTGDRLKVAVIEGGDDWTIRDTAIKPGYGAPIRRRMITYLDDGVGPDGRGGPSYRWPGGQGSNYRIFGGCSTHYGVTCWMPGDEDFQFYREASGVKWDHAKWGAAIQEVRDMYGVASPPDSWWSEGDKVWAEGARALGLEPRATEGGFRNMLDLNPPGGLYRYDSKGTALPWAYIGLNHGLKVIANAEIDKIIIEKPAGGRPVAVGAVYKDKAGKMVEVRAARIVMAMGACYNPMALYRSGYGPKDYLGDKLIVENKNVGANLSGDVDLVCAAYLSEPVSPIGTQEDIPSAEPWVSVQPRPWPELTVHIRGRMMGREPSGAAMDVFAPDFGWEHKEFMRNGFGMRHILTWRAHVGAVPGSWRVRPDGKVELVQIDAARCNATKKETQELLRNWHSKLPVKPAKVVFANNWGRDAKDWPPQHCASTTRPGASRETSVCTEDFDCHDIDNLMFASASAVPKTFFWSCGPVSVNAAYGWRRMVANHFSRGSSTKGFA